MVGPLPDALGFFVIGAAIGSILVAIVRRVLDVADDRRRSPTDGPE